MGSHVGTVNSKNIIGTPVAGGDLVDPRITAVVLPSVLEGALEDLGHVLEAILVVRGLLRNDLDVQGRRRGIVIVE